MALFGRESAADKQRAEAFKRWLDLRTPYALPAAALGGLALFEFWTLIIGVLAGVIAVVLGLRGLADLKQRPTLLGRRLCVAGIVTGTLGLLLSALMFFLLHLRGPA